MKTTELIARAIAVTAALASAGVLCAFAATAWAYSLSVERTACYRAAVAPCNPPTPLEQHIRRLLG